MAATDAGPPFEALSVDAYVAKVKTLLTGLPPTDAEVAAVAANAGALRGLVTQWMALPSYQQKMLAFFATAFQQNQSVTTDFLDQEQNTMLFAANSGQDTKLMLANHREMFARTALELIAEGRPFTETYTTTRFMVTPALAGGMVILDSQQYNDANKLTDENTVNYPGYHVTFQTDGGPIPLSESRDPTSPNFLHFYTPSLPLATAFPACNTDPLELKVANQGNYEGSLFAMFLGQPFPPRTTSMNSGLVAVGDGGVTCPPVDTSALTYSDFATWRMVNIRQPVGPELPTPFFDVATIRTGTELVLKVPRVGFYTTPSFVGIWGTNASNQARVTVNQTLIVALDQIFDGTDGTVPLSTAAIDQAHAAAAPECFSCHQQLDPMRQFFRHDYSYYFHAQTDPVETGLPPQFAWAGVAQQGSSIADLGRLLAQQPHFAAAWVQKLCQWANSAPCSEADPEFQRIVGVFTQSGFMWPALMTELFSSPLVTYSAPTQSTAAAGESFGIARQAHLCALLSVRLGLTDVCGLNPATVVPSALRPAQTIMTSYPSDQFARGQVSPVLANDPTLFSRTGLENTCAAVANVVIDQTGSKYSSAQSAVAINDFVHNLMGLPSDRASAAAQILQAHYTAALGQTGIKATDALKSTFTLACLSPYVIGIGQ